MFLVPEAFGQEAVAPLPRNSYGSVGLIDMPSARMMPDGSLTTGASFQQNIQHFNFGFQVAPWLETSFRYSGLQHFNSLFRVYYDRSFAAKLRLWNESGFLPAVAIGANDLVGTGVYSGEFVVASKQLGPFDLTLGLGWGRLGSTDTVKSPLGFLSKSLDTRPKADTAGATAFGTFFRGNAGVFAGVVWQTPIDGLDLLAEYSTDKYVLESARDTVRQKSQFNFGAAYRMSETVNFSFDWLYGDRVMGAVLFQFDGAHDPFPQKIAPPPVEPRERSREEQQRALRILLQHNRNNITEHITSSGALVDALWEKDPSVDARVENGAMFLTTRGNPVQLCQDAADIASRYVANIRSVNVFDGRKTERCQVTASLQPDPDAANQANAILAVSNHPAAVTTIDMRSTTPSDAKSVVASLRTAITKQNIVVKALDYQSAQITVYYSNTYYFSESEALKRLTGLLMKQAPPTVEKFRLVAVYGGIPQREFEVLRSPAERTISQEGVLDLKEAVTSAPASKLNPILAASEARTFPHFAWTIFPQFRQQLFDPNNPFAIQFLAGGLVSAELLRGLTVNGEGELNIYDNFNVTRPNDSTLPHVRTDFLRFFTSGKNGIGELDLQYRFRLNPEIFATAKVGYLESMFAGAGAEVLWRPAGERWAIGADIYGLQQRGYDRLLDLQSYRVITGHMSLYWASPWYDLNFQLRAGRYLAGDNGFTLSVTRRFSSGVEIGAFFTRTNVSAAQFGEGSFDKGITIRIPLGWVAPFSTQSEFSTIIRPVQRDGGQILQNDASLYEETRRASEAEMYLQNASRF